MELTKEKLQFLIDCAPEPTVIYLLENADSAVVPFLYTPDVPAFFGLTENEFLTLYQHDASKAVLPQDLPIVRNLVTQIMSEGIGGGCCTYRANHKTLGSIWTHAALKQIGTFMGKYALLGSFTDISNQVAENTPGGFFIYAAEENDQFFFIGENMLHILGYSLEEFQEKFHNRFRYMVYEPDREITLKSINDQISENGHYDNVDYRIEKKDGSLLWVHDEGHYVPDKDGNAWFYVTINDITGIVEERQKLRQENSELESIIRSIPVGLSVYRLKDDRITLVAANEAICRLFDVAPEDMEDGTQKLFSDHVHPDDLQPLIETMEKMVIEGRHRSQPFRFAGRDQKWKWLRIDTETVSTGDGSHLVYNVLTDLTAERNAEENLERAHREKQEQFQSSLQALIFANPQSLCTVRLNLTRNRCEEWYGTSQFVIRTIRSETAEGVISNISRIILSEGDRKNFLDHFNRISLLHAFRSGKKHDLVRYRRTVEDGSSIWVETIVNMVENPDTHEIEAVLFSEDVNSQVMNEEIIQKSTDSGYDYIATLHTEDRAFYFRYLGTDLPQEYLKLYGNIKKPRPYEEIREYALKTWVSPDESEHFENVSAFENILESLNKTGRYTVTFKSRKPNHTDGWKQLRLTWLDDTKDWILIQQTDVTDTIRMQQAELLSRLNEEKALRYEADKANESKSNFLSSVSHDMRTPLNAILGYDRLALAANSPEVRKDYLVKIGKAGETLLSLINDTLDLQKIENGITTIHPEPVPCSDIVNGILTAVRPMMDAKKIRFTFDNSKAVMASIDADSMKIQEIFINLLSNAVKFTPEGGSILFSVECEKETADTIYDKLLVQDSGIGISEEFLPRIYEPFSQERTEKTAHIGGSGLGLSIVKRLVDLMGGRIEVKSTLGRGTSFFVYLALKKAVSPVAAKTAPAVTAEASLTGKKILLCEDNEMNREIARAILEKEGLSVVSAVNGEEGVRLFRESSAGDFSAVLMDIRMPVMDGYESAKAIRALNRPDAGQVPIFALTADAYSGDIKKAQESGMSGHLSKPIDPQVLLRTLEEAIRKD